MNKKFNKKLSTIILIDRIISYQDKKSKYLQQNIYYFLFLDKKKRR